jgi:cyanophycinase
MNMPTHPVRKGKLIAIGGAEDKASATSILERVLKCSHKSEPRVGVITTASSIPEEVFEGYREVFARLGAGEISDIRIRERKDAADPAKIEMIAQSDVVFISGGDQMRLTNIFGGSDALAAIRSRYHNGGVIAGTSAGAACQSTTMVYGGNATDSLRKGAVKMTAGFGLIDRVIIDTHFLERGRFSRLMEVGATNPEYLGVGLGEDAAVLFGGDTIHAFGPGHVILVDSSRITGSNVFDLEEGEAVSVHNVIIHALVDGDTYSLSERRILSDDELGEKGLEQENENT